MLAKCPPCKYWLNVRWLSVRWLNVRWLNVPDSKQSALLLLTSECILTQGHVVHSELLGTYMLQYLYLWQRDHVIPHYVR